MPETQFTPLASLLGGALIGLSAVLLLLFTGRIAGISGIVRRLLPPYDNGSLGSAAFIAGLAASPVLWPVVTGMPITQTVPSSMTLMLVAGFLVGLGANVGGGCTSGHGVCGLSRLSPRSLIAVPVFMAAAAATVYIVRHGFGH